MNNEYTGRSEMGRSYFKLDNTVNTQQPLTDFFIKNGFEFIEITNVRNTRLKNKTGLEITLVWFRNLCHVQYGKWGETFFESDFDEIVGSFLPYSEHRTFDFLVQGKRKFKMSIGIGEER